MIHGIPHPSPKVTTTTNDLGTGQAGNDLWNLPPSPYGKAATTNINFGTVCFIEVHSGDRG